LEDEHPFVNFFAFHPFSPGYFHKGFDPHPFPTTGGFTKMDATDASPSLVGHRQFGNSAVNLSWVKYGDLRT
jgi:hypothetical protein